MSFPQDLLLANNFCVDCNAPNPKWASINLGVLMCIQCSGCHRALGSHISKLQSVVLDTKWTEDMLKNIREKGNAKVNAELEYYIPTGFKKPNAETPPDERQKYIEAKYVHKRFIKDAKPMDVSVSKSGAEKSSSKHGLVEYHYMLKIVLYGARDLPAKDLNGTSDPFFVFQVGNQKVKSKTVMKSLNPYFGCENLMLCIPSKTDELEITGYDYDTIGKNDYMCSTKVALNTLQTGKLINIPLYKEKTTKEALQTKKQKKESKTPRGSIDLVITIEDFHH